MNLCKPLFSAIFFVASVQISLAQDPHFSQFFASPLTLNPALTGKTGGVLRAMGNYRNQWPTINRAYTTTTLSVDGSILRNALADNDTWGMGVYGYTDKSADGAVQFNYGGISTSFHKGLDEDGYHQIGAGFQAVYANMLINTAQLKFEDQLTTSGFTNITQEVFNGNSLRASYLDLNAGLVYTGSTADDNNFYGGVSIYHLNSPRQSFVGADYLLKPRVTAHGGGYFPISNIVTMHLSGLYSSQAAASETVVGGAVQLRANEPDAEKPTSLFVGTWVRLNDAVIPYVGFETGDMRLGMTYDVNSSALKTASNSRGGFEISLTYTRRPPDSRGMPCPKF